MTEHILKGKRVLFFYLSTFNYEVEIQRAMEKEGAIVDAYNERPTNNVLARILIRINRNLVYRYIDQYYDKVMKETFGKRYDYIFFIKGESISNSIIERLRNVHPEAKIVMYYWDSIANNHNAKGMLKSFDKVLSFDKNDCRECGMEFLPLFYISQYETIATKDIPQKYDLMFAGTVHSDRYELINNIVKQIEDAGGKCFTWFYFPSIVSFYKLKWDNPKFRKTKIKDFQFTPMPRETLLGYYAESRIQIDVQHPKQTGLTMRTMETLGAKKKIITTNTDVVNYDFYRPENVLVVNRQTPIIPKEFIETPWKEIPEDIYKKYSISSWLNTIFS